jgi:hypothetical protein
METKKLTAVEKAKDFLNNFGKEIALKVVDEILEAKPSYKYWRTDYDETPSAIIYWQEVKDELNKSE